MQAMQLDIFEHSRDTMVRNDVVDALERRDAAAARSAWNTLAAEFPSHETLPALELLVGTLEQPARDAFADHASLHDTLLSMNDVIAPAARRTFGEAAAAAWLAPLWRALARQAAQVPFNPGRSDDHAAPLWLRAADWPAARDAVAGIASWRRIPVPLAWMAQARYRMHDLDGAWALLAELAWLSPGRFDQLTNQLADPLLQRLRKRFDANFEGDGELRDLAWFPAWVLTDTPALAQLLSEAQPGQHTPPEQAMRLLLQLLGLERQGRHHEMIERRKALRDVHPSLYAAYLLTR